VIDKTREAKSVLGVGIAVPFHTDAEANSAWFNDSEIDFLLLTFPIEDVCDSRLGMLDLGFFRHMSANELECKCLFHQGEFFCIGKRR
jgi:hypothetical protein